MGNHEPFRLVRYLCESGVAGSAGSLLTRWLKVSNTHQYDALPAARRLEIERALHAKIFRRPCTARTIPGEPTDRQREYLISCIRDAILRENDGSVMPPQALDAARELTARQGPAENAPIVTAAEQRARAAAFLTELCASEKLPFDLAAQMERARGVLAAGQLAVDAYGQEKGVRRRPIVEKHLKPLGYRHMGARGGPGYLAFEKLRYDGARLSCNFGFGSWRNTVLAGFLFSHGNLRISLNLSYDRTVRDAPVLTGQYLDQTMANIAFVLGELVQFLDR